MCNKFIRFTAAIMTAGMVMAAYGAPSNSDSGNSTDPSDMTFVNVIKVTSNSWFEHMKQGIQAFSQETGVNARQTGPSQATAAGQVSIIQHLIPQHPTAIGIDPNNAAAVGGVLGRAMDAGIYVFSQEAPQLENTNIDLEAFDNATYGAKMMDTLAKCMHGDGQYVTFVGHLTAPTHMAWAAAELAEAKAKFPNITRATSPVVAEESASLAYQKTRELLQRYPNLEGFLGSAATDLPGIAKAVSEAGLSGKVCIVGTSVPSLTRKYVKNGTIQAVFLWDAAHTAHAVMNAALMEIQGKEVGVGTDLHVPGYHNIEKCAGKNASDHCFNGHAILKLTKDNIDNYQF